MAHKFWLTASSVHPSLSALVEEADFTPTLYYYGTVILSQDVAPEDEERLGLFRWSDDSADYQSEAGALYRSEVREF